MDTAALTRLAAIDARLEAAFLEEKDPLDAARQRSRRLLAPLQDRPRSGDRAKTTSKRAKKGEKSNNQTELADLLGQLTPFCKPRPATAWVAKAESRAAEWIDALVNRSQCPVSVGQECIQVFGAQFDECLCLLGDDLRFLASICGLPSTIPRQAADSCLAYRDNVLTMWKQSHKVFWYLLKLYEEDKIAFERDTSSDYLQRLRDRIVTLTSDLDAIENERDNLEAQLADFRRFFDDIGRFEQGEAISALRDEVSASHASGATELLLHIRDEMLRSVGREAPRPRQIKRRRRVVSFVETGSPNGLDMGSTPGSTPSSTPKYVRKVSVSGSVSGSEGSTSRSASPTGASNAGSGGGSGGDAWPEENGKDGQNLASGSSDGEDHDEDGGDKFKVVSARVGTGQDLRGRRTTVLLQSNLEASVRQLDDLQQSQFLAKIIDGVRQPTIKSMVFELGESAQRGLTRSLLELVADGKAANFVKNALGEAAAGRDRAEFVLQFFRQLSDEENSVILPELASVFGVDRLKATVEEILGEQVAFSQDAAGTDQATQTEQFELQPPKFINNLMQKSRREIVMAIESQLSTIGTVEEGEHEDEYDDDDEDDDEDDEEGADEDDDETLDEGDEVSRDGAGDDGSIADSASERRAGKHNSANNADPSAAAEEDAQSAGAAAKGKRKRQGKRDSLMNKLAKRGLTLQKVNILNGCILNEGGEISVTVTLKRAGKSQHGNTLPWAKYLARAPKGRRARKIDRGYFETEIIPDVYMKKAVADRSLRGARREHTIAESILHYFTQKYGLRKLAEEYLLGVIKCIQAHNKASPRIKLFGALVGIVNPDGYSPTLSEVTIEFLSQLGKPDLIKKMMQLGSGRTFVETVAVLRAIKATFRVVDAEGSTNGAAAAGAAAGSSGGVLHYSADEEDWRSWAVPTELRHRLVQWVEARAVSDPPEVFGRQSPDQKYVNCDELLLEVLEMFQLKMRLDRKMLTELFRKFDANQDGSLSFDEFTELINQCQPNPPLNEAEVMDIWMEVNNNEDDEDDSLITPSAFARVCIDRNLQLPYWKHAASGSLSETIREIQDELEAEAKRGATRKSRASAVSRTNK